MKQTKIKIDKPIAFLDIANNTVIWFEEIIGNRINGWSYDKDSYEVEKGYWDKETWAKFIKKEKMNRFIKLGNSDRFPIIRQDIIGELMK